jgi:hypothetical protein
MQDNIFDDKVGDEFLIHGIGHSIWNDPQSLMDSLNHEYDYYQHFGYETKDYKREVNFYEYDIEEAEINEILDTPFNWTGYDVPYYGESVYDEETEIENEKPENTEITKSYRQLTANTGFASGGVTCKLGALCFYSSSVLVDSFVLRNPPERKARKR